METYLKDVTADRTSFLGLVIYSVKGTTKGSNCDGFWSQDHKHNTIYIV